MPQVYCLVLNLTYNRDPTGCTVSEHARNNLALDAVAQNSWVVVVRNITTVLVSRVVVIPIVTLVIMVISAQIQA